jgi:hypothetical protein
MNISVTKGQSALFKCTVSKEEEVEIDLKWTFNGLPLDLIPIERFNYIDPNSNLKLYQNGTLQILEAKNTDIGIYKCMVHSLQNEQAGDDWRTAYLNVVELPYAPINLFAELNTAQKRSVALTWQPAFDGNSPILKYVIQARITTSFDLLILQQQQQQYEQNSMTAASTSYDWFVIKDNIYANSFSALSSASNQQYSTLIYDLKPALTYEFKVSAVNGIGEGKSCL